MWLTLLRREIESHLFQLGRECLPFDPAPITAQVARAVFGIHLRHPLEIRAAGQLAEDFFGHRFLRSRISFDRVARNHDHAQLDLFLAREFVAMLVVIFLNLRRGSDRGRLDVFAAHGRDDDLFVFVLA